MQSRTLSKFNILLLIISIQTDFIRSLAPEQEKHFQFRLDDFIGICKGSRKLPIEYTGFDIEQQEQLEEGFLNATIVVKEDITTPLELKLDITRCDNSEKPKCALYKSITISDYCTTIQGDVTSPFYQIYKTIKPKWECPLMKGTYEATGPLDFSPLMWMLDDVELYIWQVKVRVLEKSSKEEVLCSTATARVEMIYDYYVNVTSPP